MHPVGAKPAQVAATVRPLERTEPVLLLGATATGAAVNEVMATGHVGAEYVEFVMRHKKGLKPAPAPLRLGDPELDSIAFREPDRAAYDELVPPRMTLDPGEPSQ